MTCAATHPQFVPAPSGPLDPRDGVHVWLADLDVDREELDALRVDLSPEEQRALARLDGATSARRFVARRAWLRRVLARYVGGDARAVRIVRPVGRAPRLDGASGLAFSASDSLDLALFAVARGAIGVDLEAVRDVEHANEIAPRYFDAPAAARVAAAHADDVPVAFLREWTRLEAVAKATDGGVFRHVARRGTRRDAGAVVRVVDFAPRAGFVGCVATAARGAMRAFDTP